MRPVVDPAWLRAHRSSAVVADVRWYLDGRSGRAAYLSGHLPGAVFVDLDTVLSAPPSRGRGRHPLPTPEHFAARIDELGIGDTDLVVAYDDGGGVIAARLVWMLRAIGHEAALLDGGIAGFDGDLERTVVDRPPATFTPRPWPDDRLATIDEVATGSAVVLDARDRARFEGAPDPVDPRAGHIPGARNLACRENLDASGRFLPLDELLRWARTGTATSSATAGPASPPATTSWPSSSPAAAPAGCSPVPGRSGATTPPDRSRRVRRRAEKPQAPGRFPGIWCTPPPTRPPPHEPVPSGSSRATSEDGSSSEQMPMRWWR